MSVTIVFVTYGWLYFTGPWTFILWTLPPRRTCSDLSSSGHVAATCRVGGMTLGPRIQLPWGHCTDNNRGGARQLYLKLPWGQCSWNSCSLVAGGWRTLSGTEVYRRVTFLFRGKCAFVLIVALWIWACTDDLYQVNVLDYFLDPSLQLNSSALIPSQLQLPKYSLLYMWSWQWL